MGSPSGRSFGAFRASWDRPGRSQGRKNAEAPMRKPLFRASSFSLLGSLVGSLGLLLAPPGPVLEPNGSQTGAKSNPRIRPETGQKIVLIFNSFWTILGPFWGPKMEVWARRVFQGVSGGGKGCVGGYLTGPSGK